MTRGARMWIVLGLLIAVCVLPFVALPALSAAPGPAGPKPGSAGAATAATAATAAATATTATAATAATTATTVAAAPGSPRQVAAGGPYTLTRVVMSSGGVAAGGAYRLGSSLAQVEAGPPQRGGGYVFNGGFANAPGTGAQKVYLPHVVR
jgi:hypothetical protein